MNVASLPVRFRVRALYEDVARQHALLDRLLPRGIREQSEITYVLFRMLDVLEDAPLPHEAALARLDAAAEDLLLGIGSARRLVLETPGLPRSWRSLFEHWEDVSARFEAQPEYVRVAVRETGSFMARGMAMWKRAAAEADAEARPDFLPDLAALDDYCQAVAGCVGELHARFFQAANAFRADADPRAALEHAAALGRYLQVVNVIRDESEERALRHRTFFPSVLLVLPPDRRVGAIIDHARSAEPAIERLLAALEDGPVLDYVRTLYEVARVHYRHYARHPEVLEAPSKPPKSELWNVLPLPLKARFLAHKLGF